MLRLVGDEGADLQSKTSAFNILINVTQD